MLFCGSLGVHSLSDIDECNGTRTNPCDDGSLCENTVGSYRCVSETTTGRSVHQPKTTLLPGPQGPIVDGLLYNTDILTGYACYN